MEDLVSCIDKIYEMKEGMEASIKTATEVGAQQDELANIVVRAKGKKHDFKDLVSGLKDEVLGYKNQVEIFKEKIAYANAIIEIYEKGKKEGATEEEKAQSLFVEQIVTTMCVLLGIVPTENEQRIEAEKRKNAEEEEKKKKEFEARNVKA